MRAISVSAENAVQAILDPRRLVRWDYVGRLSLAAAIYLAAVFAWRRADATDTLIASLAFAGTMIFTAASVTWAEIYRKPLTRTFLYLQSIFDLLLVTAVVHITGGSASHFSALYILVIVVASFLLPVGGGLLVAALGNVLYFADVIWAHQTPLETGLWLQLGVFGVVALGSGYLSARIQESSAGRAELAAELVKVRLEAADILRNIRSGIITVDARGALLYANPSASTLLGMNLQQLIGRPCIEAIAAVSPELAAVLRRSVDEGIRTTRAEALVRADGRLFPVGVTTTCSEGAQLSPATATAIFQDISDHKRLEALHMRAERLEAVAELSASLAHEIKNPLASIRSAVEQLSRMPTAGEDERILSGLIVRESDRLSRLLTEFLDFSRVRVASLAQVDLAEVARDAANLAGAHPDRQPDVRVTCDTTDPVLIEGDADLLHRAVFNLALNAVQAVPPSGRVRVGVESIAPDQLPAGVSFEQGAVALHVADDGPGIPPEIRERLFDPFFTTKAGGTGLGLPVVHRAIEAHRGLVLVDSSNGGTRFTVLLPQSQSTTVSTP